jgi:hypothetical protein
VKQTSRHRPARKKGQPGNNPAGYGGKLPPPQAGGSQARANAHSLREPAPLENGSQADAASRRLEEARCGLLFAIEHLSTIAGGREVLLRCGLDEQQQAEVGAGLDEQRQIASLNVLAGRLYDAPMLGLLARSRLAGMMMTADSAEWAQLALVLQRLPQWLMETASERAARLEAQNLALALPFRRPRRGSQAQRTAPPEDGGQPLFAPQLQGVDPYGGKMPPPQEPLAAPLDAEDDDDDQLYLEDLPALDPTMRIVAQGRIDRERRRVGWTDPADRLEHPHDRALANFGWTAEERRQEAVSDTRLFGGVYNLWQQILTVTDWYMGKEPINPATGQPFTDQDALDGLERMERWK